MTWEPMTVNELAVYQKGCGMHVVKEYDTWWIEARLCFFRPLFPFATVVPELSNYPLLSMIGGVLHLVPHGTPGNTRVRLFLYDDLQSYSVDSLGAKQRWIIKKGRENFTAKRITDVHEFIEEVFPVYHSFFKRTRYFYQKQRLEKQKFESWAKPSFDNPKIVVLGAYRQGRLCAVDISYRVENVIVDDVFFSDTESQGMRVTDFLLHTLREKAAATDARYLFRGFPSGKPTLDQSKTNRGCKVVEFPAFCTINPVALYLCRVLMHGSYQKYQAITSPVTITSA